MQKLEGRNTYTPTDASQVRGNCDPSLNKAERPSVLDLKTPSNNPEVNQPQQTEGLKVKVFVLNIHGKPLMPCTPAKAKHLLKSGKAIVVKRFPFTIQLNFECENCVQEVNLGIDMGYKFIGFSTTSLKEELICGTLSLDNMTKKRLDEKRMYRRLKRNKLWYRKSRFLNRKKEENWLPPSILRKYQTHINLIEKIKKIIPISNIIIEVAKFDIQKLENPEIYGIEYQQGPLYKSNIKNYLIARQKGICQFCGEDFKGQSLHIHHIKQRNNDGNNRLDNLILIHKKCHKEHHSDKNFDSLLKTNSKDYKSNTFMNVINKRFKKDIPNLHVTYGYITYVKRNELNLEKTHFNDAFVISGGINQKRYKPIEIIQKHINNRSLQLNRKGYKPSIRKQRYKLQPKDFFWIGKTKYISNGIKNKGRYITFQTIEKKNYKNFIDITKMFNFGSFAWLI